MQKYDTYWLTIWKQFKKHQLGFMALIVVALFCLVGIYAPFLASSKPFVVYYEGEWYFPLFRYLFYSGFYTKKVDIFFNLMIFTFPLAWLLFRYRLALIGVLILQFALFFYFTTGTPRDPASDILLNQQRHQALREKVSSPTWDFDLKYMTPYSKLNLVLHEYLLKTQHQNLLPYKEILAEKGKPFSTLWQLEIDHEKNQNGYIQERRAWINQQMGKLRWMVFPPFSQFHWEDDAGGDAALNQLVPWWKLTRINHKDLLAALIFGVRISLVVGIIAVTISLIIGIPIGAFAGYYGGNSDIIVSRMLEIWESMPTFFMLLLVVAITQSKSIFIVICVIGFFGWTGFSRYIRGEFFKQRNLPYVEACHSLGFRDRYIMFSHILPNAIPPLLTLLPFAIMGAITSEAGLSFLGLGEEGSASWGVLMDEGRTAFPAQSYLLWPPAILLTVLLVAIALVGDALRDTLDPKLHK